MWRRPDPLATENLTGGIIGAGEPQQPYRSEEENLFLAVIMQAIRDAFFNTDSAIRNIDRRCDVDVARGDARRFLCMSWGPWAESREVVCAAAGVDAELLAIACRKKLKAIKTGEKIVELDRAFVALVANADDMVPGDLDRALADLVALESEAA